MQEETKVKVFIEVEEEGLLDATDPSEGEVPGAAPLSACHVF